MRPPWSSVQQRLSLALPAGSLRARLAGGAFWSVMGAVATQGSSTLAAIMTARFLGDVGFGELGMVRNTLTMFAAFAGLGLGLTANKYLAETRTTDPARAGRILGLSYVMACGSGLLMALLAFAFAEPLAARTMANEGLARYLRLSAPILLTGTLNGVQTAALAGLEAFRRSSLWTTAVALTGSVLTVAGVAAAGISGALWAGLISGLIGFLVLQRVLTAETRHAGLQVTFRGIGQELPLLWSFALPSVLSGLMVSPVTWGAAAMLVNQPRGYGEMGVFNAANQWRNLVLFVPAAMGQVVLPMLSNLQAAGERDRYVRALKLNGVLNLLVCTSAALPVVLASEWIMRTYGPDFRGRWLVLVVLVLSGALQAVTGVVGQALASLGRMWWGLILNAAWALELLTFTWLCLPLGATGLALAYLVSYLLHLLQVGGYTVWVLRYDLAPGDRGGFNLGLAGGAGPARVPAPAAEAEAAVEAVVASGTLAGNVLNPKDVTVMLEPMSPQNVNTEEFWQSYMKNNWDQGMGRQQTRLFAQYFLETVRLPEEARILLDVSCAMGDALPEIHRHYPRLQLFGHDVSETAIAEARKAHGQIARFRVAGFEDLREHFDVIYCSNTLEHFEHSLDIADHLLGFCDWLYVQVPFKELRHGKPLRVEPGEQHVTTFYQDSFNGLVARGSASAIRHWVRFTPGAWGTGKVTLWRKLKALARGRPIPVEYSQIIYELRSAKARSAPPPSLVDGSLSEKP